MHKKLKVETINLKVQVYQPELREYGKRGLKCLLENIIERYFHPEYFEPDLVGEIKNEKRKRN